MLTGSESMADFREITNSEKTALEASDAVWVRPPQSFIDQWNIAAGSYGRYNEATGFFELNGITDIGYEEALMIMSYYPYCKRPLSTTPSLFEGINGVRTLLPIQLGGLATPSNCNRFFASTSLIVVNVNGYVNNAYLMFLQSRALRKILGVIDLNLCTNSAGIFQINASPLEEVYLKNLKSNISFNFLKYLRIECYRYIIENAANTTAITITVHPEVFAKITDEDNEEWHALLTMAMEKNIQFASA